MLDQLNPADFLRGCSMSVFNGAGELLALAARAVGAAFVIDDGADEASGDGGSAAVSEELCCFGGVVVLGFFGSFVYWCEFGF